ncbi:OPA3-like protein [Papaver somniferum]|uniref:OPA3-like protein n=1 Tax=Papaver somniferum TaxID=3469 RepID=UPI000E6FFB51|nr:OPA3-like protein [Papaver somniferum]
MMLSIVKLGSLVLRTICKPIASRLKVATGKHPRFRRCIINVAQTNHRFTTTVQRQIYGHATDVAIRPLNEEKAVQAAADLLGELFVVSVAGSAIIFEVQRNARSEARKEELRKQELEAIKQKEENLQRELQLIRRRLAEVENLAKARGILGIFNFRNPNGNQNAKLGSEVHSNDGLPATHAEPETLPPAHSTTDTKQGAPPGH